jgi:hypothetical protein
MVELGDGARIPVREASGSGSPCGAGDDVWVTFRDEDAAVLAAASPAAAAGPAEIAEGSELTPV